MTSKSPYQPPSADVIGSSHSEPSDLRVEPRYCRAGEGWHWITGGFALFKARIVLWIGMFVVYIVMMLVFILMFGPIGGLIMGPFGPISVAVVGSILGMATFGGFMVSCRRIEEGQASFGDIFAGFQSKFRPLSVLGLIYMGLFTLAGLITYSPGLIIYFISGEDPNAIQNPVMFRTVTSLVLLVFTALITMGMLFAPALVVFHDVSPWRAFKQSLSGCWKNIIPLLVYGIIILLLTFLATIPLGLGLLILGPTVIASIYVSYKRIFLN